MKRVGTMIGIRPDQIAEYKTLHAEVWPTVLAKIRECNIANYSIFLREPENVMFSYFEYVGSDYEADMARMAADPETQRWWAICGPKQAPLETRAKGEWWAGMEEVFHVD